MNDIIQAQVGRPAGAVALTPDQIAAAISQTAPVAPVAPVYAPVAAPVYPAAPIAPVAPAAPIAPVAPAAPAFNVGTFDIGTKTPEQYAQENAQLKTQMAQNTVFTAAGGKEEFAAMSAWAQTGRTPEANAQLNSALNDPNVPEHLRVMAVNQAMNEYKTANPAVGTAPVLMNGDVVLPGLQHGVAPLVEAISEGDFQGRYIALRKEGKDSFSPEMRTLETSRMAGLAQHK